MTQEQIQKLAEGIEQDFKSLRVYLDGLYYQGVHQIKDAGHLWIEFTDKFSAFEKRVKAILQDKRPESQQPITTVDEDIRMLKQIRNYFGENDKVIFNHTAYDFLNGFIKKLNK